MKMQISKGKVEIKKVENVISRESQFISNLLLIAGIPNRKDEEDDDEESDIKGQQQKHLFKGDKTRASSLQELQQRLYAVTSKKKLTYKDKLTKKNLKNRVKKKSKHDERNANAKLVRAQKATEKANGTEGVNGNIAEKPIKPAKPVFNSEDKIVFSKFDFSDIGNKKIIKKEKDPKKLLKNLQLEKEKIKKLQESGEVEKAIEIKEKTAWKNALAKAEGIKVKDDPLLLKKTVKKQEQKQKSSKKKWEARLAGVSKAKEEKQNKRTENIQKRKKEKKTKKLKGAAKRGKIIPGF